MSFRDSALLLAWVVLVVAVLGVIGLARAVNMMHRRLNEGVISPRRLAQGDVLRLPDNLRHQVGECAIILFVSAGCGSCQRAVDYMRQHFEDISALELLVLWSGDAPAGYGGVGLTYQDAVFQELHVAYTPFSCLIMDERVAVVDAVASPAALEHFRRNIERQLSTRRLPVLQPARDGKA